MCGCAKGRSGGNPTYIEPSPNVHGVSSVDDCPYSFEQIQDWLNKAICFKEKNLYTQIANMTEAMVNSYVGTLMSALNYPTNICYFRTMLEEIEGFITIVISTGQC